MKALGLAAVLVAACAGCAVSHPTGDAAVWTSPDGLEWSRVDHPDLGGPGEQQMIALTAFGDRLVAVGLGGLDGERDGRVWVASEPSEWTVVADPELGGSGDQVISEVIEAGPGLVAVGFTEDADGMVAEVWVSSDGLAWSRAAGSPASAGHRDQAMFAATVFGDVIVAGGRSGDDAAVWLSRDGLDWTRVGDDGSLSGSRDLQINGLAVGGPGVVAVGRDQSDATVWTSADGVVWDRIDQPEVFGGPGYQWLHHVVEAPVGLVAVGGERRQDRINFMGRGGDDEVEAVVWSSSDGRVWQRVVPGPSRAVGVTQQTMFRVRLWGTRLVATGFVTFVGTDGSPDGAVWLSDDGAVWVPVYHRSFGGQDWQDIYDVIAWRGGLVAVGGDDYEPVP